MRYILLLLLIVVFQASAQTDQAGNVLITMYNTLGQDFTNLIGGYQHEQETGNYKIPINAEPLEPGVYFIQISINGHTTTKKLIKL